MPNDKQGDRVLIEILAFLAFTSQPSETMPADACADITVADHATLADKLLNSPKGHQARHAWQALTDGEREMFRNTAKLMLSVVEIKKRAPMITIAELLVHTPVKKAYKFDETAAQ